MFRRPYDLTGVTQRNIEHYHVARLQAGRLFQGSGHIRLVELVCLLPDASVAKVRFVKVPSDPGAPLIEHSMFLCDFKDIPRG